MALNCRALLDLNVLNACSQAPDGDMKDASVRSAFLKQQGLPPKRMLYLRQTHSDSIITIESPKQAEKLLSASLPEADAWVLSARGYGAAVFTADCAPVLLWDADGEVLGIVHAGWRGAAKLLPAKTAARMVECGAKTPLSAFVGPRIQSCCFEVGPELRPQFPESVFINKQERLFLDLGSAIKTQLLAAGLPEHSIELHNGCTCCGENYFSFRRDRGNNRQMNYIFKK